MTNDTIVKESEESINTKVSRNQFLGLLPKSWCVCWNTPHCHSLTGDNLGDYGCLVAEEDCNPSGCALPRICFCNVKHPKSDGISCAFVSTGREENYVLGNDR